MLEHVSIPFNVLVEVTVRIVCIICIAQSTFNALLVGLIRLCCFCRLSGLLEFSVWHVILVLLKPGTLENAQTLPIPIQVQFYLVSTLYMLQLPN